MSNTHTAKIQRTYPIVDVTAVLADPISLPVLGIFFCLGGRGLFVTKYVQGGLRPRNGWNGALGGKGGCETQAQSGE